MFIFNFRKAKALKDSLSIEQKELAEAAGLSEGCISDVLNGNKKPGIDAACRIAKCLGVSVDSLMVEVGDMLATRNT